LLSEQLASRQELKNWRAKGPVTAYLLARAFEPGWTPARVEGNLAPPFGSVEFVGVHHFRREASIVQKELIPPALLSSRVLDLALPAEHALAAFEERHGQRTTVLALVPGDADQPEISPARDDVSHPVVERVIRGSIEVWTPAHAE
jgi:hypothetical protein